MFFVTQHYRDKSLMDSLKAYFNCGVVRLDSKNIVQFKVSKIADINANIIPFFFNILYKV
jgi:hypothetical protein